MSRVLVLNAGSTGLKWSVLADDELVVASGNQPWTAADAGAREAQIQQVIRQAPRFDAVGHRVVHGGSEFRCSVLITSEVRAALRRTVALAPDHNALALAGIEAAFAAFPAVPQVAAFDTSFHAGLPDAAAHYALPYDWTERWHLRRYGFHGLSVGYAVERARSMLGALPPRMVVCHLGGGCSVTAVLDGRSVDTTMGYTPFEGLVMATRSGSVDPGMLLQLQLSHGLTPEALQDALAHRSGLLGVSGVSGALPQVLSAADAGDRRARLAYDMLVLSVRRAVGAAAAVLGGLDAMVFSGGMGENSARLRDDCVRTLGFLGVFLDAAANEHGREEDRNVNASGAFVPCLIIRSREELAILREVRRLIPLA